MLEGIVQEQHMERYRIRAPSGIRSLGALPAVPLAPSRWSFAGPRLRADSDVPPERNEHGGRLSLEPSPLDWPFEAAVKSQVAQTIRHFLIARLVPFGLLHFGLGSGQTSRVHPRPPRPAVKPAPWLSPTIVWRV